ncbi:hypothetical protein GUJ93_ZPchr0003g17713 [Zizania palustris]|uniref:Uncharacterized protein n=1 Tax=Zizania palustris TaxID=103762 RepID=A0A8J5SS58_ZIZPA|nr:hypothetical protein GUJ93_ZPchr0003g17713 [Zizania palustris]
MGHVLAGWLGVERDQNLHFWLELLPDIYSHADKSYSTADEEQYAAMEVVGFAIVGQFSDSSVLCAEFVKITDLLSSSSD